MYLKKVEISGFKSFANKTSLEFLPACHFGEAKQSCGITAIVGPNGSGKSNVADAIKWALGEQSMKTLRGKKSEDIIFAGSGKKTKLGSAEVKLHFNNSDKRIPLEYAEVTITRKIFRSGESEYLINGNKVRLLDITDLLAKAGVGRESYCVINQGMSDALLSATPTERRMILEDAAGVKQYQIQKERSLRRLDSTKENLDKVASLVQEIEPHLRMLKRQAEKAQQSKVVAGQLREKQEVLFAHLWQTFQTEREKQGNQKEALGVKMMHAQREADILSEKISSEAKTIEHSTTGDELEKARQVVRNELNQLERELILAEGRLVIEKEKLAGLKVVEIVPVDLRYVQSKLEKIRTDHESLIKRIEQAEDLKQLQDLKEFARAIQQELFDLHSQAGKGEVEIKKDNTAEETAIAAKIEELSTTQTKLKQLEQKLLTQVSKLEEQIRENVLAERRRREKFFELERELRQKQEQLNRIKDEFNEAKVALARVEVREEDLTAEIRNELRIEPSILPQSKEAVDREKLEREISRLKLQMEQIGGIDPLVVDEYNETNARFDFLMQEGKDLEQAIVSLKEVVKEMDKKIGEQFETAFDKINHEFGEYFKIIFGGGKAELIKVKTKNAKRKAQEEGENLIQEEVEGENPEEEKTEMGVEIFACPPGKKITNLSMLSGGERALTSLALLFAIISHNPPPFAILDEVEAALDEANSRRFGKILAELSGQTQFVAITHNRETMRQASLLYGVTMGDDGVSKLLSVHLDQIGEGGKIKAQ